MNGILNLLKPSDMSSQQAVSAVKRIVGEKRVGHGGTLDPAAAGVLPVFLGQATRLSDYTMQGRKTYLVQITFGASTDTQDAQGTVLARSDKVVTQDALQKLIDALPTPYWQTPPAYSAIKIDGQKMVDLARKGKTVDIPKRPVTLYETKVLTQFKRNEYLLRIVCSKGTYVRTLCHDLGELSGAHAHCSLLLRTQTGQYALEDSVTFEQLIVAEEQGRVQELLTPMASGVVDLPSVTLLLEQWQDIRQGKAIEAASSSERQGDIALLLNGELAAIAIWDEGLLRPKKVFEVGA